MEAVRTAVDNLADALLSQLGTHKAAMTTARSDSQKFEVDLDYRITDEDYYLDLWHMADRLAFRVPAAASAANALKSAVANAVLAYRINSRPDVDHSNARGLGIYWPPTTSGAYGDYVDHGIFTATRG